MNSASSRAGIDPLVWLIEEAFEGDPAQSLLANLRDLREKDCTATPKGLGRSIADILEHVGWSKWMYEDYAFGDGTMRGDQPPLTPAGEARSRPRPELLAWLKEGHARGVMILSWTGSALRIGENGCLPARLSAS